MYGSMGRFCGGSPCAEVQNHPELNCVLCGKGARRVEQSTVGTCPHEFRIDAMPDYCGRHMDTLMGTYTMLPDSHSGLPAWVNANGRYVYYNGTHWKISNALGKTKMYCFSTQNATCPTMLSYWKAYCGSASTLRYKSWKGYRFQLQPTLWLPAKQPLPRLLRTSHSSATSSFTTNTAPPPPDAKWAAAATGRKSTPPTSAARGLDGTIVLVCILIICRICPCEYLIGASRLGCGP